MGRLVSPAPKGAGMFSGGDSGDDNYLTRVAKYVPVETVAAYIAIQNIASLEVSCAAAHGFSDIPMWWFIVYAVLLLGTPAYLQLQRKLGQPYKLHMLLGTVAFILWSYALTACPKFSVFYGVFDTQAAAVLLIIFSFVSGILRPTE